jgi:hypothetical protein
VLHRDRSALLISLLISLLIAQGSWLTTAAAFPPCSDHSSIFFDLRFMLVYVCLCCCGYGSWGSRLFEWEGGIAGCFIIESGSGAAQRIQSISQMLFQINPYLCCTAPRVCSCPYCYSCGSGSLRLLRGLQARHRASASLLWPEWLNTCRWINGCG